MKNLYLILGLAISGYFLNCSNATSSEQREISELEAKVAAEKTPELIKQLLDSYDAYLLAHPEDEATNSSYLYKASALQFNENRFTASADYLRRLLHSYPAAPNAAEAAELLGTLYMDRMEDQNSAHTTWQALLEAYPTYAQAAAIQTRLKDVPPYEQRMQAMLSSMTNDSTGRIDFRVANDYINSAELYATIAPEQSSNPQVLYKAGEVARAIRMFERALDLYTLINERYPEYENSPKALFMRAFTLEEDLGKTEEARAIYEEFLRRFPEDDFADDAQMLLNNLGKTDEEIFQQFEQQQQQQKEQ